jgi:hypothetical protein
MRSPTWLLLLLLAASPIWAKPKVDVRVRVNEGIARQRPQDSLSKGGGVGSGGGLIYGTVYFLNVTVLSDNAEAVARNNGQWCITGDTGLAKNAEYQGTLKGNDLVLEVPQKNGKIKKKNFEILDHKWRKLADL